MIKKLTTFLHESLEIEGIHRPPSQDEIEATDYFLGIRPIQLLDLNALQSIYAPDQPLRDKIGMDVEVGNYVAPKGGPELVKLLKGLLVSSYGLSPWKLYGRFEQIHPYMDGNGRTGRALWAWSMIKCNQDPFEMPFLNYYHYQTLEEVFS